MSTSIISSNVVQLRVFVDGPGGGNPAAVVLDADGLQTAEMHQFTARFGHETSFVQQPSDPGSADLRLRFFMPGSEMNMCGHAALGSAWLLARQKRLSPGQHRIETASGVLRVRVSDKGAVAISQPKGQVEAVDPNLRHEILDALDIKERHLLALPLLNASTSRMKTLIPLTNPGVLAELRPKHADLLRLCTAISSTGFYAFSCDWEDERTYHARQFPASTLTKEDAATGVAATALFYGLRQYGLIGNRKSIRIRQGAAMGQPSKIAVTEATTSDDGVGVWLTGEVEADKP